MKSFSEETRRKMSESAKRRCATKEWLDSQHKRGTQLPYDEVVQLYNNGMTQTEIGDKYGVSQKVVYGFMKRNGIPTRIPIKRDQRGEKNSYWHGGYTVDEFGYVMVKCDDHPRASKCGGYVPEHIIVAETMLGRFVTPDEVVHHKNGCKWDNRSENLAVMSKAAHMRLHTAMRKLLGYSRLCER